MGKKITVHTSQNLEEKILNKGNEIIRRGMQDPELLNFLQRKVCGTANQVITSHPEWKVIRKNELGEVISHRFTKSTNWKVSVEEDDMSFAFKNITRPSASIFASEQFGASSQYDYDPARDPFDGAALSVWIDEGLWIDLTKLFKEMARVDGYGTVNADTSSLRRNRIPFKDETHDSMSVNREVRDAIVTAINNNK